MKTPNNPFIAGLVKSEVPNVPLMESLRAVALEALQQKDMPTNKHEEWRFSEAKTVTAQVRSSVVSGTFEEELLTAFTLPESVDSVIPTFNGRITSHGFNHVGYESGTPEDLGVEALGAVKDALNTGASYWDDAFKFLNDATAPELVCVVVPPDSSVELPIHLLNVGGQAGSDGAISNRTIIVVGRNSKVTLVEEYRSSSDEESYFRNAMTEVVLGENAHVTHIRMQEEGEKTHHLLRSAVRLGANSHYDSYTMSVGAAWSRHDLLARHEGDGAFARIDGLVMLVDEQLSDTHSILDNTRPHCNSHQLHKCIVGGKARAVFNGKILVQKGAQKIDAYQLNRSLLLSPNAKINTKPQLEILADDVRCTHGATIGQLDDEQIFYLKSRGYDDAAARGMLTYAFAGEIIDEVAVPSLKKRLETIARNRTQ